MLSCCSPRTGQEKQTLLRFVTAPAAVFIFASRPRTPRPGLGHRDTPRWSKLGRVGRGAYVGRCLQKVRRTRPAQTLGDVGETVRLRRIGRLTALPNGLFCHLRRISGASERRRGWRCAAADGFVFQGAILVSVSETSFSSVNSRVSETSASCSNPSSVYPLARSPSPFSPTAACPLLRYFVQGPAAFSFASNCWRVNGASSSLRAAATSAVRHGL